MCTPVVIEQTTWEEGRGSARNALPGRGRPHRHHQTGGHQKVTGGHGQGVQAAWTPLFPIALHIRSRVSSSAASGVYFALMQPGCGVRDQERVNCITPWG